ncbi:MAG: PAS domain S-box protein [Alphaproteobacteria bacterium]|nr:PAS domain S-box protein [Alphaproteobacteria bacterium]
MGVSTAISAPEPLGFSAANMLDGIEAPAALLGADLKVIVINEAARLHASDRSAPGLRFLPGRSWRELCQEAEAVGVGVKLEALPVGIGEVRVSLDYTARRRSRFKAYRLSAKAMAGGLGQVLMVQTDLTRLAVTEQRLIEAEQHLADLAELSSDWLWSTDGELRFVELASPHGPLWRRVQPRLIGQSLDDLLGKVASEISRRRPFRDVVAEVKIKGKLHRIRFSGKPQFDTDGDFEGYVGLASDFTAAHDAEVARDAAERRLRDIAELSSDWFWETDGEHRFTYVSEAQHGVARVGLDQAIGRRRIEMIDEAMTDPAARARHLDDLTHHRPFRDFIYGSSSLGKFHYVKVSGKPRFDEGGRFLGHVGTTTDVTQVVESEKRREAAERRLKDAVEHMPGGIAIWDEQYRLVVCNDEYWSPPSDGIGRTYEELARQFRTIGPGRIESADREARIQERIRRHRNPPTSDEVVFGNGEVHQVNERRLGDGSMVTVTMDISRLKRREKELSDQRSLLQTTLDHISDGIMALDEKWQIVAVNDTFGELLGLPGDLARVGASFAAVVEWLARRGDYGTEQAETVAVDLVEKMSRAPRWYDEREMPDGRHISWRMGEIQGGGRLIAVADVSEQRQAERRREELRTTMAQAQQLESLSRLAGGLGHDLNNMLLPVMTLTELAMDELPEGSPARGDLERVISAAEHARGLVQQLMTFTRSAGKNGRFASLDLVLAEASDLLRATVGPNLFVRLELGAPGAGVPINATEIQQIVMNLGTNAAQALGERRGTLTIETALVEPNDNRLSGNPRLDPARRHVRLTVTDDGPGIPAELLPRIFEPFFTTKAVGKGTGLGLAVVHGLVSQCGGVIEATGDAGARFDILFPVADQAVNQKGNHNGTHSADR